jgi:hypothetical protein
MITGLLGKRELMSSIAFSSGDRRAVFRIGDQQPRYVPSGPRYRLLHQPPPCVLQSRRLLIRLLTFQRGNAQRRYVARHASCEPYGFAGDPILSLQRHQRRTSGHVKRLVAPGKNLAIYLIVAMPHEAQQ